MNVNPTTSSFSVNSLLDISKEKSIASRDLRFVWSANQISSPDLRQSDSLAENRTAIFESESNMNQANEKTLIKLEPNVNGTAQEFELSHHCPNTTMYNGMGNDSAKIRNGAWHVSPSEEDSKLMGAETNQDTPQERPSWNPAFPPCLYKRQGYADSCSIANKVEKDGNKIYPNEQVKPVSKDKNSPTKPKTWGSSEGSDAGTKKQFLTQNKC